MDSSTSTSTQEEKDSDFSSLTQKNKELKKANKELWNRVEELQKEKTSIANENTELKREIDLSLSGNTLKSSEGHFNININISGPKIKIKTEDGELCACAENNELRKNLRDFQEKHSKTLKLLKVREMELEILKNSSDVVQLE